MTIQRDFAEIASRLNISTTNPTGTERTNHEGNLHVTALNVSGTSDTATAASHYYVETASDGFIRPKTLANVKSEIVGNSNFVFAGPTVSRTYTFPDSTSTVLTTTNVKTVNGAAVQGVGNIDVGGGINGILKCNGSGVYSLAVAGTDYATSAQGAKADTALQPAAVGVSVGYLNIPSNPQTTSYTLALSDVGKSVDFSGATGQTITIPANASVAFPIGSAVTITNNSANNLSIAITTDSLRMGGTTNTGTRTLIPYGVATARKVDTTLWFITGAGLT